MKLFLKKVWIFVRTYWYVFATILLGVAAIALGGGKSVGELFDLIEQERELGKKETKLLETAHRKEKEELARNAEKFSISVSELKKEKKQEEAILEKRKLSQEEELARRIKSDPDRAVSSIAKEMGWDFEP